MERGRPLPCSGKDMGLLVLERMQTGALLPVGSDGKPCWNLHSGAQRTGVLPQEELRTGTGKNG